MEMTEVTEAAQSISPLQKIVAWSKGLPKWQQDALRRIIESGDVDSDDVEELVQLCLLENDIEVDGGWVPKPIADGSIPVKSEDSQAVSIASISDAENANALDRLSQVVIVIDNRGGQMSQGRFKVEIRQRQLFEVVSAGRSPGRFANRLHGR